MESIFDDVNFAQIESSLEIDPNQSTEEKCSQAMLKVISRFEEETKYSEDLLARIIDDLQNYPKENFFASKL